MSGFANISLALGAGMPPPPNSVLVITASAVLGGTTTGAIRTSFDGGASWLSPATPLAGQAFIGGAFSPARQECLLLSPAGVILRSTDMVSFANLVNDIGSGPWTDIRRNAQDTLYIACGQDSGDTTHRISTSPDGVTWTKRDTSAAVRLWVRLGVNPVTGIALCGGSNFNVKPFIESTDGGVTWALPAGSYGGGRSCYEFAFSAAGRYFFGDRGSVDPSHSDDLSAFTVDTSLGGGQTMASYDPVHDLVVMGNGLGIWTSPATGPVNYTQRASTLHFQTVEDMIWQDSFAQLIGVKPISGSETAVQIITSTNGVAYAANAPGFPTTSAFDRITEAFVPA